LTQTSQKYQYYKASASIYYSILLVLPALALYEITGIFLYYGKPIHIRNGIDVLVNRWLFAWGPTGNLVFGFLIAIIALSLLIRQRNSLQVTDFSVKSVYFLVMIFESLAWATLFLVMSTLILPKLLANPAVGNFAEQLYLSLGAGIFEELFFRLVLISGLFYFFNRIIKENIIRSAVVSLFLSGLVFSIFHYLGYFGEEFHWYSFVYRLVSGLFLGVLFLKRGYGITVYTHIFYDVILVSVPVISN